MQDCGSKIEIPVVGEEGIFITRLVRNFAQGAGALAWRTGDNESLTFAGSAPHTGSVIRSRVFDYSKKRLLLGLAHKG